MGLFDNLLGLAQSQAGNELLGQLAQHLPDVLAQHGINGTQGLAEQLAQGGLSQEVASWMGSGPNLPVNADQIEQALGTPVVASLAQKFGVDPSQASQFLSEHLPQIISSLHGGQPA